MHKYANLDAPNITGLMYFWSNKLEFFQKHSKSPTEPKLLHGSVYMHIVAFLLHFSGGYAPYMLP